MQLLQPERKVSNMKKFRELTKESKIEDQGFSSEAARTLKEKPNKEPMPKLKEETDTTEKVEMTQSQLHFIHYACEEILDYIDDGGEVEEWYQVKVAKAFSEFESMHSFIEGEKRRTGMVKEEQIDEISQNLALNTYAKRAAKASSSGSKEDQKKADTMIGRIGKRWTADAQRRAWNRADKLVYGTKKEEVEMLDELDKEPGGTLHRYLASPKQRQRRIKAAIENPDKLKKINKGMRSAETKIEKERQKQTGMNPQYQPPPPTPRQIQKMDLRYTHEQTESVPASKSLQKAHDDERKKRGLPDPSYYLELMKKKKQEIEDMKKEEVNLDEKITVMPAGTPNTGIQRVKLPSGGTITTGSIARGSTTRPAPSSMIAKEKNLSKEEVELHEISKKTLGSYISKASSSAVSHGRTAGVELGAGGQKRKDIYNREEDKAEKRLSGIKKAVGKLSKEEVEQIDEISSDMVKRARDAAFAKGKDKQAFRFVRKAYEKGKKESDEFGRKMAEEIESLEEKNVPTSPEKWSQAKAQAKAKFDIWPSAYASGWASKKYKEMGGGWKSVSEETELEEGYYKSQEIERQETERLAKPPFTPDKPKKKSVVVGKKPEGYSVARHLARQAMKKYVKEEDTEKFYISSRKTQIVKNAAKNKNENKFEPDPVMSKMADKKD